jgi:hypothetical protein
MMKVLVALALIVSFCLADSRLQEYKFSSPNIVGAVQKKPSAYIENGPSAATEPEWDTNDPTPPDNACVEKCRADKNIHTQDDFKKCWHRCPRMKLSYCEKLCLNNTGKLNNFRCIDNCKEYNKEEEEASLATSAPPAAKKALEHVVVKVAPKKKKK